MLNRIWLITKLEICNLFGINQLRHSNDKKEKSKTFGFFFAYLILYIVFGFYSFMYATIMCDVGAASSIPAMFTLIGFVLVVFTTILKAGNVLFNLKSYERLAPLPVRPIEIVISRFINIYITSVISALVFYLPAMIIGGINLSAGIGYYGMLLLQVILMPLLAIAVSILFGTLLTLIVSKIPHKNVFRTILMVVFLVGVLVLSFIMPNETPEEIEGLGTMIVQATESINKYFIVGKFVQNSMVDGSLLDLLYCILIEVVPFAVVAFFASWKFVPLCQNLNATRKTKAKEIKETKVSSTLFALVKRDIKRLLSSSLYLVNSCFGYILLVIFAIVIPFTNILPNLDSMGVGDLSGRVIAFAMGFAIFLNSPTSCSISIEGKNWWILKSLPVKTKDVMNSKIITNLIVVLPFYLISTIINCVFLKTGNWLDYVFIVLVPFVGVFFSAVFGLWMNLKYPYLNWTNEAEACKQSKSVGFMMLFSMLILAAYAIPCFALKGPFNTIYLFSFSLALIICTILMYKKICNTNIQNID